MVFKAPAAPETELAETVAIKPEEIAEEDARAAPKEEPKVEKAAPKGPVCPKCGDAVEPGWKVCPSCDADIVPKAEVPPKPPAVEKPKEALPIVDKIMEKVPPAVAGKCPKCGDEVEADWKVCPSCDAVLRPVKVPELKKEDEAGKKKIVWSKIAKDKALTKEPAAPKTEERPKVEAKPEAKRPEKAAEEALKEELDALSKEIEGLEKGGKDIKKAKSLATLASSFLKGKQPDKARIYIERARAEMKK
jgi:hypothetical protein